MLKIMQGASLTFVALILSISSIQAEELQLSACQKVNSQVGLIVRSEPNGDKIDSLKFGQKVKPAGEFVEGEPLVNAKVKREGNTLWVKIKAPVKGWVLFASDDDPEYTYLVPCE